MDMLERYSDAHLDRIALKTPRLAILCDFYRHYYDLYVEAEENFYNEMSGHLRNEWNTRRQVYLEVINKIYLIFKDELTEMKDFPFNINKE